MENLTLIYDGGCGFCSRQAARLQWLTDGKLLLISSQDPGVLQRYGITPAEANQAMQLLLPDGRRFSGAAAVAQALTANPFLKPMAKLYQLPLVRNLADATYRCIAQNRHRLSNYF